MDRFEDHCWKDIVDEELLEIYRHYQRDTYIGDRPALLAIDLYNLVYQGGPLPVREVAKQFPSACGEHAWNAIEPTKRLFAAARALGLPVIYTRGETRPDARPGRVRATNRQVKKEAPDGMEIHEAFRPEPGDLVIHKQRASGFYGTPLAANLTMLGVNSLIVCGESTSGCVRASVVDAYSHGFHTVVVEECVFDRSVLSHKVSLFDLHHKYADVMHLDEVLDRMKELPARRGL
jgi:nicotinamidase-related amidase